VSNEKKQIVIKDACVLFDLIDLNLMDEFYELNFSVYTSPAVIFEITNEYQLQIINRHIQEQNIIIDYLGNDEFTFSIFYETSGLSITDCSVIELAIRRKGIILTSDKSLRIESKKRNINVHGVLWIIEELVNELIISVDNGLEKLEKYYDINPRIPKKEFDELVNKLKLLKKDDVK